MDMDEQEMLADAYKVERGWYSVAVGVIVLNNGKYEEHCLTGEGIASCKMDAYNKFTSDIDNKCAEHGYICVHHSDYKHSTIEYIGVKK